MKKSIATVFALFCFIIIILRGCFPKTHSFLIESPQKITMISIRGDRIEIDDESMVQQITDNITSIQFKRGRSSKDINGFGPIISWYDSNDDEIETVSVMDDDTIMYHDYFWTAVNGRIDMENINILLTNPPDSILEHKVE